MGHPSIYSIGAAITWLLLVGATVAHCLWLWLAPKRALQEIIEQFKADDYHIPAHEAEYVLTGRRRWITFMALILIYFTV